MFIRKNIPLAIVVMVSLVLASCLTGHHDNDEAVTRANQMLARMTLEDKIGQMSQLDPGFFDGEEQLKQAVRDGRCGSLLNYWGVEKVNEIQRIAVTESRLGIPLIIGKKMSFMAIAPFFRYPSAWQHRGTPGMVTEAFRISSVEASSQGIKWTFAPMLDITWDPRWGRIAEGCGEDPVLASAMARAMVEGIQGDDLTDPTALAACAKHYVGYGFAEAGRDYNTTYISEPLLRDVVLKPFKAATDAGALSIMSAFNDLNGVPATGNEFTLKQILRDEWGFKGMVVSDWASVTEMVLHGYATDDKDAAVKAINAGVDMEMSSTSYFDNVKQLLEEKKITEAQIDDAVRNILTVKYRLGLFDNPYVNPEAQKNY